MRRLWPLCDRLSRKRDQDGHCLDLRLLPEYNDGNVWTTVHEEALFECRSCGAVVASVSTVEDLKARLPDGQMDSVDGHMAEYCSDCKGDLVFKS
ncbi:hypothetical protein [Salinadaptatus halalkaliphilus]|uniref:hypothetical protein n=1 Tax=Salinadaptatus halalkaliphilus TaxID=2419781 RepID=UPI001FE5684A|nr:hypothetical protein [Salinadaptatus halalkaliphilus]